MTVIQCINRFDELKPNNYTVGEKVAWLSELDGRVKAEIIDTHIGGEDVPFSPYTPSDEDKTLLIPAPYDAVYITWLESQVDYANGETHKYANSYTMFNTKYEDYANYYNRTKMPVGKHIRYW